MKATPLALAMASALSLAACTTPSGPVEVTRFVAPDRVSELGSGPIFVESAPGGESDSLALAPYKAAVAEELRRLGYSESDRAGAGQIARVSLVRYMVGSGKGYYGGYGLMNIGTHQLNNMLKFAIISKFKGMIYNIFML